MIHPSLMDLACSSGSSLTKLRVAESILPAMLSSSSRCQKLVNITTNRSRRTAWSINNNLDNFSNPLTPSSSNSNASSSSTTRLVRMILYFQTRLIARIQGLRKDLPTKMLFFLVGFYCATAFATMIGQTGEWDILSAGFAVVVVEGIGALMYKKMFFMFDGIKNVITMFNYWKNGLVLGLYLDAFKY